MLEINVCSKKDFLLPICKKIKYPYSSALYAYVAKNKGVMLACALFFIHPDYVEIIYYESTDENDDAMFDGVLRAGLNYASSNNINSGYVSEEFRENNKQLFKKINFPNEAKFNINNYFLKYKNCR